MSDDITTADLRQVFAEALERSQVLTAGEGSLWLIQTPPEVSEDHISFLWEQLEDIANRGISVVFVNFPIEATVLAPPDNSLVLFAYPEDDPEGTQVLQEMADGYQEALEDMGRNVKVELSKALPVVWTPKGGVS